MGSAWMQFSLWIFVKAADCWECSFMASSPRHCPCMTTHAWPVSPAAVQCHPCTQASDSAARVRNQKQQLCVWSAAGCWEGSVVLALKIIPTYLEFFPGCRSVFLSSLLLGILKQDIDEFERYLYLVLVYIRYLENLISNSLFGLFRNLAPLSRK